MKKVKPRLFLLGKLRADKDNIKCTPCKFKNTCLLKEEYKKTGICPLDESIKKLFTD